MFAISKWLDEMGVGEMGENIYVTKSTNNYIKSVTSAAEATNHDSHVIINIWYINSSKYVFTNDHTIIVVGCLHRYCVIATMYVRRTNKWMG